MLIIVTFRSFCLSVHGHNYSDVAEKIRSQNGVLYDVQERLFLIVL